MLEQQVRVPSPDGLFVGRASDESRSSASTEIAAPRTVEVCDRSRITRLVSAYLEAKRYVLSCGFADEIAWQASVRFEDVTESYFLREAAWVVLAAGMKETVIRRCFPKISAAFCEWSGAEAIAERRELCMSNALLAFNHRRKIRAITDIACRVNLIGFPRIRHEIWKGGTAYLAEFPFIGPVTSFHLAKNLGLDVAKPDRHLVRVANIVGHTSPADLCRELSETVGDSIPTVDIVIWRYASLRRDYIQLFTDERNSD